MISALTKLQEWYRAQCDGDWERSFGVLIGTLDTPGWIVKIDLSETILADDDFPERREASADGSRWMLCRVVGSQWEGSGDPGRLEQILEVFLEWAANRPEWLSVPPHMSEQDLDREFWELLGEEVGPERCRRQDCSRNRIEQSVLCRPHHYQMIRGMPCPFEPLESSARSDSDIDA